MINGTPGSRAQVSRDSQNTIFVDDFISRDDWQREVLRSPMKPVPKNIALGLALTLIVKRGVIDDKKLSELAENCGVSKRTMQRHLDDIAEHDFLVIDKSKGFNKHTYRLSFPSAGSMKHDVSAEEENGDYSVTVCDQEVDDRNDHETVTDVSPFYGQTVTGSAQNGDTVVTTKVNEGNEDRLNGAGQPAPRVDRQDVTAVTAEDSPALAAYPPDGGRGEATEAEIAQRYLEALEAATAVSPNKPLPDGCKPVGLGLWHRQCVKTGLHPGDKSDITTTRFGQYRRKLLSAGLVDTYQGLFWITKPSTQRIEKCQAS
jgi:hypothetical protein